MNAREVESTKEFIERRIKYENILLKWITMNMTNEVIELINPTPSYKLYRDMLYSNNNNFEYIFTLLNECAIKYVPFNDEYVTFSISKEHPNSLNYWLYFDLKTNTLECIDIPGEYLLLMICFNLAGKILNSFGNGKIKEKPKDTIQHILECYNEEHPYYKTFLKPYQYKLFEGFLMLLKRTIMKDEYFTNNIFNIDVLSSRYLCRSLLNKY